MANKNFDESEGVWRTVGGRRIFIRTGQSLSDAMKASGKFKRKPTQKEEQHNLGQNYAKSIAKGKELDEKAKERLLDELRNKSVKEIQDAIDEDPFSDEAKIAKEYLEKKYADDLHDGKTKGTYQQWKNKELGIEPKTQEEKNNLERIGEKEPANKAADDLDKVGSSKRNETKIVADYENGAASYEETLEKFGGNQKELEDAFKKLGYTPPSPEAIQKANERAFRASMGDVDIPDNFKEQFEEYAKLRENKERLEKELKQAETDFVKHYDKSDFNNEDWRKKSDELLNARMQKQEEFNKAFQDYVSKEDEKNLSWQDRVRKNDLQREEDLKSIDPRYHSKEYYGKFKEYEEKNAKIKEANAKPEDLYEPISSYYSFNEKRHEFAGDKMDSDGSVIEWGDKKFTGKGYTNDEFMEHLEDANWHTERRMLETAGLTNQELSYIKDRTTLDSYGVGEELTGRENTQKMIDEAKAHFAKQASSKSPFESKRVAENEIAEKGYKYYSTHGASLGTIPSDVNVADTKTHEGGWTSFKTDRPLTTEELKRYDIQDESRNAALDKRFGVEQKSTSQYMNDKIRSSKTKSAGSSDIRTRWAGTLKDLTANGMSEADALEFIKKYLQK